MDDMHMRRSRRYPEASPTCPHDRELAALVGLYLELKRGAPRLDIETYVQCCPPSVDRDRLTDALRTLGACLHLRGGHAARLVRALAPDGIASAETSAPGMTARIDFS